MKCLDVNEVELVSGGELMADARDIALQMPGLVMSYYKGVWEGIWGAL